MTSSFSNSRRGIRTPAPPPADTQAAAPAPICMVTKPVVWWLSIDFLKQHNLFKDRVVIISWIIEFYDFEGNKICNYAQGLLSIR